LCANNSPQPKPVGRWRGGRAREEEDQGRRLADERRRGLTCSRTGEGRAGKPRGGVKGKKLLPLLLLLLTLVPFH
jgi:hypothetical protein